MAYGDEFLNGENSEKNISDLKSKLVSNTILVFNLKKGQFEVVSGRKYLDDYFLFGTSQNLSERSDEEIHQELRSEFYSFTDTLKKMNLIISKLDTNNVDYRFVLVYYIKLLRHLPFRRRGFLSPDTSLFPNLIFVYTSKLYDGDIIHHYKTE